MTRIDEIVVEKKTGQIIKLYALEIIQFQHSFTEIWYGYDLKTLEPVRIKGYVQMERYAFQGPADMTQKKGERP